jgi:glycosyltransferase involved in cell wall biosynthesis
MDKLHILQVQPLTNGVVSTSATGGIEQITAFLDREFSKKGHQTTLFAKEGSHANGFLECIPSSWTEMDKDCDPDSFENTLFEYIAKILSLDFKKYSIIHNHFSPIYRLSSHIPLPIVTTLHMSPVYFGTGSINKSLATQKNIFVANSETNKRLYEREGINVLKVINNGIDLDFFMPDHSHELAKDKYILYLGRLVPEKGAHIAIQVALQSSYKLIIAGEEDSSQTEERQKYCAALHSQIDGEKVVYAGKVEGKEKLQLIRNASALIVPTTNHNNTLETASLVCMEAAACGIPVIASDNGALSETVEDKKSGYICKDVQEMTAALAYIHLISTKQCREIAEKRFSITKTAEAYLDLFFSIRSEIDKRNYDSK